ncbi:MAG: His/Gly/Thr/Pro-type tRNA ligase C-terminal domain-containing protein, partial [Victivallaceae bacterium]
DRGEKAGFMFSDADLLGIPLRVVISPKSLAEGKVELKFRKNGAVEHFDLAGFESKLLEIVKQEYAQFEC